MDTFEEEQPVDLDATKENIAALENELRDIRVKMDSFLNELGL